jgi:hypothetical protein
VNVLVGLSPFIAFALLSNLSIDLALWAAFAAAFAVGIRDFVHYRVLRLMDAFGTALFGLLALYAGFLAPGISTYAVRLIVDGGFLVLALFAIALSNPFILPSTGEQSSKEREVTPEFKRMNYTISSVWGLAFAIMTAADAAATFSQRFSPSLDLAIGLGALTVAIAATARYAVQDRTRTARTDAKRRAVEPRSST